MRARVLAIVASLAIAGAARPGGTAVVATVGGEKTDPGSTPNCWVSV